MQPERHVPMKDQYLVIVEDDADDHQFIRETFDALQCDTQVQVLRDGNVLLDYLEKAAVSGLPALILLDYHTPRLGGEEALELLKKDERFRGIPVAIYSNSMPEDKEQKLLSLGASFCRTKPATMSGYTFLMSELIAYVSCAGTQVKEGDPK